MFMAIYLLFTPPSPHNKPQTAAHQTPATDGPPPLTRCAYRRCAAAAAQSRLGA